MSGLPRSKLARLALNKTKKPSPNGEGFFDSPNGIQIIQRALHMVDE